MMYVETHVLELRRTCCLNSNLDSTIQECFDLDRRINQLYWTTGFQAPSSSLMAKESHLTLHKAKGIRK